MLRYFVKFISESESTIEIALQFQYNMCTVPTTPQKTCYLVMSGVLLLTILWVFSRRFSQDLSLVGTTEAAARAYKVDCENRAASDSSSTHEAVDDLLGKFVTGFPEKPLTLGELRLCDVDLTILLGTLIVVYKNDEANGQGKEGNYSF